MLSKLKCIIFRVSKKIILSYNSLNVHSGVKNNKNLHQLVGFGICHPIDDCIFTIIRTIFFVGLSSLLESKYLVICNNEVLITSQERSVLSRWVLIGAAESTTTGHVCICII